MVRCLARFRCPLRIEQAHSPGLTSAGGSLPPAPGLPKETVVAIRAQGKDLACAIGKLMMPTEEIKSINKGHGVESIHYLGDDLFNLCGTGGKGL